MKSLYSGYIVAIHRWKYGCLSCRWMCQVEEQMCIPRKSVVFLRFYLHRRFHYELFQVNLKSVSM